MGCAKDGNLEDFKSIDQSARDYQAKQERQADETIQACKDDKLTERQAKESLARQFGLFRDRKGFQKAVEKLEQMLLEKAIASTPDTKPRGVSKEQTENIPRRSGPIAKDKYGRLDQMPGYNPNIDPDAGKIDGFKSGVWAGEGKLGKNIQDRNDPIVQSTHLHIHKDGTTLTTHYRDGRTERYNLETGEQQEG